MKELEDELRDALRRVDPPPGFAERVIARAGAAAPARVPWFRVPGLRWAAAAACCLFLFAGLEVRRQQQIRLEGEAARVQLVQALRIAGGKLELVRDRINRHASPTENEL